MDGERENSGHSARQGWWLRLFDMYHANARGMYQMAVVHPTRPGYSMALQITHLDRWADALVRPFWWSHVHDGVLSSDVSLVQGENPTSCSLTVPPLHLAEFSEDQWESISLEVRYDETCNPNMLG